MRIYPARARGERPVLRLDPIEQRWLFALCRHWQRFPGPVQFGGPSAEQLNELMEAIASYTLEWENAKDGNQSPEEWFDSPPF